MARYLATVPVKFSRETHPLGATPDDLIAIEAADHGAAAEKLRDAFGRIDTWCSIYGPGELTDEARATYYPGREIELLPLEGV